MGSCIAAWYSTQTPTSLPGSYDDDDDLSEERLVVHLRLLFLGLVVLTDNLRNLNKDEFKRLTSASESVVWSAWRTESEEAMRRGYDDGTGINRSLQLLNHGSLCRMDIQE